MEAATNEQQSLVETFIGITSSTPEEAVFFLESHNWQLDSSIHSFFENQQEPPLQQQQQQIQQEQEEEVVPPPHSFPIPPPTAAPASRDKRKASKPSGSRPRVSTLADLNRKAESGSDSDSDTPQEYYAGGEKSGMLVQGPSKGGHDVDAIFDQARQMAATQEPFEHHPSSSSRSFTGTGRLLSGEVVAAAPRPPENITHNIIFWSDGFTVNDGPLRRFDDPQNASFLESITKSECPKELVPEDRRSAVHVDLVRREEKYPEPVKRQTPFHGAGRTLGSGSSAGSITAEPATTVAATVSSLSAGSPLVVDDSLPTASIQLRFADGTRMVARFNTHHTVGDIRTYINNHTSRHGAAASITYTLQTVGFPPKQLSDVTQTIEQAGLANSVVIQKLS